MRWPVVVVAATLTVALVCGACVSGDVAVDGPDAFETPEAADSATLAIPEPVEVPEPTSAASELTELPGGYGDAPNVLSAPKLDRAIGVASHHGLIFFTSRSQDFAVNGGRAGCDVTARFAAVDAVGVRQTMTLPGEVIHRVEIGVGGWGFATTSCDYRSWVVPLRLIDGKIVALADSDAGTPLMYAAVIDRLSFFHTTDSLWLDDRQILVRAQAGQGPDEALDLATGERTLPPPLPFGPTTADGRNNSLLATDAHARGTYYLSPSATCFGDPAETAVMHVVSSGEDRLVLDDPGEAFSGLSRIVFGPDDRVAWLNSCSGNTSVWSATADPTTGTFGSAMEVLDEEWLSVAGWSYSAGGLGGPLELAFTEAGALIVWAQTDFGLEAVTGILDPAGSYSFRDPTVIVGIDVEPPVVVTSPEVLATAQPSDVDIAQLDSFWPAGVAERAGLVFYGFGAFEGMVDVDACDQATTPVFAFHDSAEPQHVAVVPGTRLISFDVAWSTELIAVSACGDTTFLSVGMFDVATRTIAPGSLRTWKREDPQSAPAILVNNDVRWGPWVLDTEQHEWTRRRNTLQEQNAKGLSDSGRYRYYATPGFLGDEGRPTDPSVRLMVEDTTTGVTRATTNSPRGAEAWRLIFGPGDEVAWMSGNELGTGAYLGRIDWSTGEIVEAHQLLAADGDPYWGHPRSGSGKPGVDAIAFEADGTLRAWAYTYEPGNPDQSTWTVATLTFNLDDFSPSAE